MWKRIRTTSLLSSTAFIVSAVMGLSLLSLPSFAQQRDPKIDARPDKTAAAQPGKELEKRRKQRAVLLVKDFANRAFSFEDTASRVFSIARFADLLCGLGEFSVSIDGQKVIDTNRLWYPTPGKVVAKLRKLLAGEPS